MIGQCIRMYAATILATVMEKYLRSKIKPSPLPQICYYHQPRGIQKTMHNHGRSYYRGRRGDRLVCFCPDHGYIPQKTAGQGHFGHFWSLRLV